MSETVIEQTENKTENSNKDAKVAGLGKVERMQPVTPEQVWGTENVSRETIEKVSDKAVGANAEQVATNGAATTKPDAAPAPALTEDQLKEYFKSIGVEYEGTEKLKEKLNFKPAEELSEEQKTKQSLAREKKAVDLFVKNGGTVEQYVAIKKIAESDLNELSITTTKAELKTAGFNDEQIEKIIKERYYQIDDEEIEQEEDESDKDFKKRAKDYFAQKLSNRSSHTKQQAQGVLDNLNKAIESEDLEAKEEATTSAKIDDLFKSLPRKLNFEIGEVHGQKVSPVEYEVSETDLANVQKMLKTPKEINNFLYNQDGSLNLTNISNVLTRNAFLESAIQAAYHEGGSRQVAIFRETFPATSAQQLGVGGSPVDYTAKKEVAGFGKNQRVPRQQHN